MPVAPPHCIYPLMPVRPDAETAYAELLRRRGFMSDSIVQRARRDTLRRRRLNQ